MVLKKLSILNYKNIHQAEILFSPKINCFFGNNGMGKTNLLDAIYYLSFCKNYMNIPDSQLVSYDEDMCLLQGYYDLDGSDEEIFCAIRSKQKKTFKRNKKEYDKLSEHIGLLPLVMASPADAELIQGGSAERRRFLDLIISQHDRYYLHTLINYNKALIQRNTLLRMQTNESALYDVLEMQLATYGETLYNIRSELMTHFIPVFKSCYEAISNSTEQVDIAYISKLQQGNTAETLAQNRDRDRQLGYTSYGAHKDELEMTLGSALMRRAGSQGQNKTFLIALKFAQFILLKQRGHTTPILLLDDIFDKLDAGRVEQIIQLSSNSDFGQIFITDTNRKYLDQILASIGNDFTIFRIDSGQIQNMP